MQKQAYEIGGQGRNILVIVRRRIAHSTQSDISAISSTAPVRGRSRDAGDGSVVYIFFCLVLDKYYDGINFLSSSSQSLSRPRVTPRTAHFQVRTGHLGPNSVRFQASYERQSLCTKLGWSRGTECTSSLHFHLLTKHTLLGTSDVGATLILVAVLIRQSFRIQARRSVPHESHITPNNVP